MKFKTKLVNISDIKGVLGMKGKLGRKQSRDFLDILTEQDHNHYLPRDDTEGFSLLPNIVP